MNVHIALWFNTDFKKNTRIKDDFFPKATYNYNLNVDSFGASKERGERGRKKGLGDIQGKNAELMLCIQEVQYSRI